MGLRITTWNVNGLRNPFGYQPWRNAKTFDGMFDILEADIVVFQETKIQKKDLRDDMVLVRGWDCYFSLPKHKKGYSGVVIYTRNATCSPIRAEEGLTGLLCPPGSSTPFRELPTQDQIGGYPTNEQLAHAGVDPVTLDSEGRCIILEFPAFILLGVYSPANRDETRDNFRLGFVELLNDRLRNLVAMGKRVVVAGDLNVAREAFDSARAADEIRKNNLTADDFCSSGARRVFNQLLQGGKVVGERDVGKETPILYDTCREFHPDRKGMYTCWEQRINARPGNFGARIDYVLCSLDMTEWISSADIQEGLMGSDHCPVYATFKDKVQMDDGEYHLLDLMNPPDTFKNGERVSEYSSKDLPRLSGRLLPEFSNRQSIRDMFSRRPTATQQPHPSISSNNSLTQSQTPSDSGNNVMPKPPKRRHTSSSATQSPSKQMKSEGKNTPNSEAGQSTIQKFFGARSSRGTFKEVEESTPTPSASDCAVSTQESFTVTTERVAATPSSYGEPGNLGARRQSDADAGEAPGSLAMENNDEGSREVTDPIVSKESWSKLFRKKRPPNCEGHSEACISLVTKKPGINCGRSFWICPRPLGPSGQKEVGTQWRCSTFIWSSDWNGG